MLKMRLECERTDGDAEAVQADEVLAAVAAGDLLAVAALGAAGLGVDVDLGVLVGGTLGEGNSGHGGDDERLEEGHFEVCWFGLKDGFGKSVDERKWLLRREVIVG